MRLRSRVVFILQCSLGAGASWWLASALLGHPTPYLAPVVAIVCLGLSFGQRFSRIVEVTVGVAIGVLIGGVFAQVFGAGAWQIMVSVALSMCSAALLGGGVLISTQAAVQSIIVMTLVTAQDSGGVQRWFDAVIGALVALALAALAPGSPIEKPRDEAARVARNVAAIVRDATAAYRTRDSSAASAALERARATEDDLDAFIEATREGLAVVRSSPLLRRRAGQVHEVSMIAQPLDRAVRNVRVLVRRLATAIWRDEEIDADLLDGLDELAAIIEQMSLAQRSGTRLHESRGRVVALGEATSNYPIVSLSSAVLTGQLRSLVIDLLEVTGLENAEAMALLPAFHETGDGTG